VRNTEKDIRNVLEASGEYYRSGLGRWTHWVTAKPWLVIGVAIALTIASIVYLSQNIAVDTSTGDMLSEELDFRKFNKEMDEAFPKSTDSLLIVIEGQTADRADAAALQLADALRTKPNLFQDVYDLAGDPYFRKNGLLYLDLDGLYDLSDKLAEAQPFLASLWRDPSLNGLFILLAKGLPVGNQTTGEAPFDIGDILNRLSDVAEAQISKAYSELSWRALMETDGSPTGPNRRFILVEPALDFGSLQPASQAMDGVRELSKQLGLTTENGVRIRLSGSAALEQEELESVEGGMGLAGLVSFILVVGLLIIGLRSGWAVICCLITLIFGLVWTAAFAIIALGSLNLISVAFAVLFIGLSVDFGIHYTLRFEEFRQTDSNKTSALAATAKSVGVALTLSAIGAAIAFYSFMPTDYDGLAELGLIAGTGMFIAFFANITLLPALLSLKSYAIADLPTAGLKHVPPSAMQGLINQFYRPIIVLFIGLAVLALFWLPNVEFDFDPLNLKNRQTESMSTLIDLMADSRTSPYTINVLASSLESADEMAASLSDLDTVESAETLASYVPQDQDEKLDVISTMALFLSPAFSEGYGHTKSDVSANRAVSTFIDVLQSNNAHEGAIRLRDALLKISSTPGGAGELESRLLAHLPSQLDALKLSLDAEYVNIDDLPSSLRMRKLSVDGRAIIDVYPRFDVTNQQQLTEFVQSVRTVAPRAIGSPVVILEAGKAILGAFYQAGALSITLIAVMLLVVLGSVRDVLLVFAPLVLAGLFTLAASGAFALPFNFANVIVLPLLFGLGVAGGIHLVSRANTLSLPSPSRHSTTARAILFSALTTMGSFGSIALSTHPGTASMGVLLTIAITLTLFCTLVFLPALMVVFKTKS